MRIVIRCDDKLFGELLLDRARLSGRETLCITRRELDPAVLDRENDRILLVLHYPFTSSPEAVRLIRAGYAVAILSSVYDERVIMKARQMGVKNYVSLPIDLERFTQRIAEWI